VRRTVEQWDIGGGARWRAVALVLVVLALALPAAVADTRAAGQLTTFPPAFDGFLDRVRDATPRDARLLIVDPYTDAHGHLLERGLYVLYPRKVIRQPIPPYYFTNGMLTTTWSYLRYRMRANHTPYLVVWMEPTGSPPDPWGWALPQPLRGTLPARLVRLRDGWGTLVEARV